MIRSMFTAVNSLYLNQQYMDVVADNLSNVNTPGFKSNYVRFKDQFAQTLRVGGAPSTELGGVNPMQIGLGTNMATISPNFSQGALTSTSRDLDMAISGDGFFVYNDGIRDTYSRDGSLAIDAQGYLVHASSGERIQGWMASGLGTINTGSPLEALQMPIDSTVARATTGAYILGNLDAGNTIPVTTSNVILAGQLNSTAVVGTTYDSSLIVQDATGANQTVDIRYTKVNATTWSYAATSAGVSMINDADLNPIAGGSGTLVFDAGGNFVSNTGRMLVGTAPITLNMTNLLQPAGAANNITAGSQNGTAAGSYDVTMGVYDELGVLQPVAIRFTRTTNPNNWTFALSPTDTSGASIVDVNGNPIGSGTVSFDTAGQWVSDSGYLSVPGSPGATTPTLVNMDLAGMTMLATANSAALGSQDGLAAGSLMGFNVSANTGEIYGAYSNGDTRLVGQLALAMFVNPSGLLRQGGNKYVAALNSGEPRIGAPAAGGRGTIASGYVEGSNVDMSREFANMILAQRGFQASSRVINTSDQMLQELVNLGR
jgi:flagellar hook protein FlgE